MLKDIVQTGDVLFAQGDSMVSKIIRKVTSGITNHVGLVYDKDTIFETDLSWGKAELHALEKYEQGKILIVRLKGPHDNAYIQHLCRKYDRTPYSFVDIVTNFLLSPFNDKIREGLVSKIGTKKYAICSELTAKILYEATNYPAFKKYEGLTPQDILTITRLNWPDWELVLNRF